VLLLPVGFGKTGGGRFGPAKKQQMFLIMGRLKRLQVSGRMILPVVAMAASVSLCAGGEGHALRRSPPARPPLPQAYLFRVGPPSLRYESAGPCKNEVAPTRYAWADSKPVKNEMPPPGSAADAVAISSSPTNNHAVAGVEVVKAGFVSPPPSLSAATFAPSVMDQSVVTPEMLADYLKPLSDGNDGTPAAGASAKLQFTLPTLMADHASRAVYKSE